MQKLHEQGLIVQAKPGSVPRFKRYLDEGKGVPLGSVWDDIGPVQGQGGERLGYPTQKPLKLLERIIEISSQPNDIVLDAFCGCGTALVAAQNLGRQWIGIDISPTSCRVMAKRLRDICKLREDEQYWLRGKGFVVRNLPTTEKQLREMPPFEFENWAVNALGGIKNKAQVGDMGIDGRIFPVDSGPETSGKEAGELDFMDEWYPVQVKQKEKAGRPDIDSFEAAMMRAKRKRGYFVSFGFTGDAIDEIRRFQREASIRIIPITVAEILDDTVAEKLI
jgi:hypothetical protein